MTASEGEYDSNTTRAEIFVSIAATCGVENARVLAEQLVESKCGVWREQLLEDANAVALVGLTDLAKALRQVARRTPRKPLEELNNRERLARGLPPSGAGEHYLRQKRERERLESRD